LNSLILALTLALVYTQVDTSSHFKFHVNVVAGHTRSWGLGYPELLTNCSADYYPFGAVNPLSKYTYQFMTTFWREIADLFPDSTVHVGGDEINYKCWCVASTILGTGGIITVSCNTLV